MREKLYEKMRVQNIIQLNPQINQKKEEVLENDYFTVTLDGDRLRERALKERGFFMNSSKKKAPDHSSVSEAAKPTPKDDCFVVDWCME